MRHVLQSCGLLIVALVVVMTATLPSAMAAQAPTTTLPAAGPTTTTPPPKTPSSPGLFDIAGRVRQAVNDWFRDLVSSALTPTLDLLGRTVLATPDVTAPGGRARELWWVSAGIAFANALSWALAGQGVDPAHVTDQLKRLGWRRWTATRPSSSWPPGSSRPWRW